MSKCPKCATSITDEIQCPKCQLIFAKHEELKNLKRHILSNREQSDSPKIRAFTYPITALLSFLCVNSLFNFIFSYFKIWVHEFGHAIMSWLSGIKATPLSFWGFGMTFSSSTEKSFFVFVCFVFLMVLLYSYGKRERSPFLSYLASISIFISIIATWFISFNKTDELIIWAGNGGELILGTLLIISFYYRFPKKWFWEYFFRWPVLFIGFFTVISSTKDWLLAFQLNSLKPFGVNTTENAVMGVPGDLFRLMNDFNWSLNKIINTYMILVFLCWIIILGHYFYFLKEMRRRA